MYLTIIGPRKRGESAETYVAPVVSRKAWSKESVASTDSEVDATDTSGQMVRADVAWSRMHAFDVTWRETATEIELELSSEPFDKRSAALFSGVFDRAMRKHKRIVVVERGQKRSSHLLDA